MKGAHSTHHVQAEAQTEAAEADDAEAEKAEASAETLRVAVFHDSLLNPTTMRLVKQIIAKRVWSQSTKVYNTQTPLTECQMDKFESRINSSTICNVVHTTTSKNNETGETQKLFSVLDLYTCTSTLIGNVHVCSCPNTMHQNTEEPRNVQTKKNINGLFFVRSYVVLFSSTRGPLSPKQSFTQRCLVSWVEHLPGGWCHASNDTSAFEKYCCTEGKHAHSHGDHHH